MNRLIMRGMVAVAGTLYLSASTLAIILYDAGPLNASWYDHTITSLADDTKLSTSGPTTITGVTIGFFGTFAQNEGISATVNLYRRVGANTGAVWTRGAFLGSSTAAPIVGSSFFDVFFNINVAVPDGDLVTEVVFSQQVVSRGVSINQSPTIGSSDERRIQEDGVYWDFLPYGPRSNMRVILNGPNAVPEPFTMSLGIAAAGAFVRRRLKAKSA